MAAWNIRSSWYSGYTAERGRRNCGPAGSLRRRGSGTVSNTGEPPDRRGDRNGRRLIADSYRDIPGFSGESFSVFVRGISGCCAVSSTAHFEEGDKKDIMPFHTVSLRGIFDDEASLRLRGSYTVEVALIMPFILISFILLLYLSFYLHDRAVLRSEAARAAVEAASGTDRPKYERIADRLLMGDGVSSRQEVTSKRVKVTLICKVRQPRLNLLRPFTPGGFRTLEETSESVITDPAGAIWKIRKLEHMTKGEESKNGDGSKTGASEKHSDR